MQAPVLGIDFGTTKTLVSYCDPATGRPRPILLGRGSYYLPTTVYAAEGGEFLFGDAADDEMELDASRYCRGFKMELGSDFPVLGFDEGNEFREFTARELTCKFLRYVRQTCEQRVFLGQSVQRAVITCPVSFSRAQRADLQNAAEQAGFREVQLLSEPEAAGLAFCHLCPEGAFNGEALILDWGGGTLDMALVTLNGKEIAIHSSYTDGRTDMGGELFDDHIWQYVARQLRAQHGVDLDQEAPEVQGRIRTRLRQEKERLSLQERHKLRLASSTGALPPVELTRAVFESLIAEEVDQAVRMAVMLCDSIRESVLKPEILLLVGGTSLIPCIAESLKQQVGVPCYPWEYVREAVSLGAAIKGNEAAAPPRKVLIEHTLQLTPQEMASGCLKVIPIQNKKLEVRIPAGVKDGTKLRLSGERTQGLGVVMLLLRTAATDAPGAPPLKHTLRLTAQEMASGCVKTVSLLGRSIDVRIPSSAKDGAKLRLSGEKTQGLGVVMLKIKQAEVEVPPHTAPPLEHTLQLTQQEMSLGCTKTVYLEDRCLEVRVPAGVKIGTKLRLSADKTQGLGVIILRISQKATAASGFRMDPRRRRIEKEISELIEEQLGIEASKVHPSTRLKDAGADSLDAVELIIAVEDKYSIEVPDEVAESLKKVSDIVDYIMEHSTK